MPRGVPWKYVPLAEYLAAQPATVTSLTLTVPQIGAIIGGALPPTARRSSWWTARGSAHARQWRRAGWRVAWRRVIGRVERVTFERLPPR